MRKKLVEERSFLGPLEVDKKNPQLLTRGGGASVGGYGSATENHAKLRRRESYLTGKEGRFRRRREDFGVRAKNRA